MSKVLGIVAEYNPFHNGHLYHLNESKKVTGATYTVAVMSGNFTQRGSTSFIDKWSRAKSAIDCGVDLVVELPVLYATSSAENFAYGAIKILNSLQVVDYLSFGAETADMNILSTISEVLYQEPKEYKSFLAHELKAGLSFPKAREKALNLYFHNDKRFYNVINSPNNILGIEYLKALKKCKSNMQPVAIERHEAEHNDLRYSNGIASSTAIRNIIKNNGLHIAQKLMPDASFRKLLENMKNGHIVSDLSIFEKEIMLNLRRMSVSEIADLPDVSEGLEYAIKNAANSCNSIVEFLNIIKSKRYTSTRLQRILVYSLLGITKKDMALTEKTLPYIRVLGFNNRGKYLISEVSKSNPRLNIITSVKKFTDNNLNKSLKTMLDKDIFATDVYTIGYEYDSWANLDFTNKIVTK